MGALGDVQRVKQQLTGATSHIARAREIVDEMAGHVRRHLEQAVALLDASAGR
jgi:hypothetical protein